MTLTYGNTRIRAAGIQMSPDANNCLVHFEIIAEWGKKVGIVTIPVPAAGSITLEQIHAEGRRGIVAFAEGWLRNAIELRDNPSFQEAPQRISQDQQA